MPLFFTQGGLRRWIAISLAVIRYLFLLLVLQWMCVAYAQHPSTTSQTLLPLTAGKGVLEKVHYQPEQR